MKRNLLILFFLFIALITYSQPTKLEWVKTMGGNEHEFATSSALDKSGNIYTTGGFEGKVDFDSDTGTFFLTSFGDRDIFVSKYDSSGKFIWVKQMGGKGFEGANSITIDKSGNIFTTGYLSGTADFDPGSSLFNLSGFNNIFISKLDSSGNFIWAKNLAGSVATEGGTGNSIILDRAGNIYVAGTFKGTVDFNPGPGTFNLTSAANTDGFVLKLDSSTNFLWAIKMGANLVDHAVEIVSDSSGNTYTIGYFYGTVDFDPGAGILNLTSSGYDVFILKLNSNGNLAWVKQIGGTSQDEVGGICLDIYGNIYATGFFHFSADFDPGPGKFNLTSNGGSDIFVLKLNSSGNFVWAKSIGGVNSDAGSSIKTDIYGNVYVAGDFSFTADFDPGNRQYNLTSIGYVDVFALKLKSNGNFVWAKKFGGRSEDRVFSITVDKSNKIYTTGFFTDTCDFDPGADTLEIGPVANWDIYLHKLGQLPCNEVRDTVSLSICHNYLSPTGRYNWTSSGVFQDTIRNEQGCDSIVTFNLTILEKSDSVISPIACNFFKSPSGKYKWVNSNTYNDTLVNNIGCDSILIINLTIIKESNSIINPKTCNNYRSPSGRYNWISSGTYKDTLVNKQGCDSLVTINLTISRETIGTISITVCDSYKSPSGKYTWTSSNTYRDTIKNIGGCDSVIIINLTINTLDIGVVKTGVILTANIDTAIYQWLDCNNKYSIISDANKKIYTATKNGSYAVKIIKNTCVDTSICYDITTIGIKEKLTLERIKIYPNPASGILNIEYTGLKNPDLKIQILNSIGQIVIEETSIQHSQFNIQHFPQGLYLLRVISQNQIIANQKIIKQ